MKYNHALVSSMKTFCTPSTEADNERLYLLVREGNADARQEMITNNMPLVIAIVDGYLKVNQDFAYLRDDLTSEGFLRLVQAVSDLADSNRRVRKPTAYLSRSIRYSIFKNARHSPYQLATMDTTKRSLAFCSDSIERVDTQDLIDQCCETDLDRQIIGLRKQGNTFAEIAETVRLAPQTTVNHFNAVQERYDNKIQELLEI